MDLSAGAHGKVGKLAKVGKVDKLFPAGCAGN